MKIFNIGLAGVNVVVFVFAISCSESVREIKSEQLQKRRDGLYYAVNEEKPYSGNVIELYKSGQKHTERTFKSGKLQEWHLWTKEGEKRETDTITDFDGNIYLSTKIGEQWWMAENLKVTHYRNGNAIANVIDDDEWANLNTGAYCFYQNDESNAETYGGLYNWHAVNDSSGLAPMGWHVPSDAEWKKLVDYLDGDDVAGGKMKEMGITLWVEPNTGATNESGLCALAGGYRNSHGTYDDIGSYAYFWSSTDYDGNYAWPRALTYDGSRVYRERCSKQEGLSVRCVRD